jgi:hypothetical protein
MACGHGVIRRGAVPVLDAGRDRNDRAAESLAQDTFLLHKLTPAVTMSV